MVNAIRANPPLIETPRDRKPTRPAPSQSLPFNPQASPRYPRPTGAQVAAVRFDPDATSYNAHNALLMSQIARVSKWDRLAAMQPALRALGFPHARYFEFDETEGLVASGSNAIVIAFPGSDSFDDWLTNIDVVRTEAMDGEVHRGFHKALKEIWGPMAATVREELATRPRPVFVTGHSLGAAIATLAALDLQSVQNSPVQAVYLFGSPRVGNEKFAEGYDNLLGHKTFRHENNNDRVCRVPAFAGWTHVAQATERYLTRDGEMRIGQGFWDKAMDRLLDRSPFNLLRGRLDGVVDHGLDNYIAVLARHAGVADPWIPPDELE